MLLFLFKTFTLAVGQSLGCQSDNGDDFAEAFVYSDAAQTNFVEKRTIYPGQSTSIGPYPAIRYLLIRTYRNGITYMALNSLKDSSVYVNAAGQLVDAFGSPVSGAGISAPFTWSGIGSTSITGISDILQATSAIGTLELVAGAGVTSAIVQWQATDSTTAAAGGAGAWTTIAQTAVTAAGTAYVPVNMAYLAYRVVVATLAGGSLTARFRVGATTVDRSFGQTLVDPTLTGVPVSGPFILSQKNIPVLNPSSGSMANNGVFTLTTGLTDILPNLWIWMEAGAISSGSAAGVYYATMTSNTVGTVYNNKLTSGEPYIPASPVAFVTTGPGAFGKAAGNPSLITLTLPANALGANGALKLNGAWQRNGSANVSTEQVSIGGVNVVYNNNSNQKWYGFERTMRNQGVPGRQVNASTGTNLNSDVVQIGNAPTITTINTATAQTLVFSSYDSTAADWTILHGYTVQVMPSA